MKCPVGGLSSEEVTGRRRHTERRDGSAQSLARRARGGELGLGRGDRVAGVALRLLGLRELLVDVLEVRLELRDPAAQLVELRLQLQRARLELLDRPLRLLALG